MITRIRAAIERQMEFAYALHAKKTPAPTNAKKQAPVRVGPTPTLSEQELDENSLSPRHRTICS